MALVDELMTEYNRRVYNFSLKIYEEYKDISDKKLTLDGLLSVWCKQESTKKYKLKLSDFDIFRQNELQSQSEPVKKIVKKEDKIEELLDDDKIEELLDDVRLIEDDDIEEELSKVEKLVNKVSKVSSKKGKDSSIIAQHCIHVPTKSKKLPPGTVCGVKVRGEGQYCGKHKKKA